MKPGFVCQHQQGLLEKRAEIARRMLKRCGFCARRCGADRFGNVGVCRAGKDMEISGYGPHYGEEDVLVGRQGSGTIFFARCTLHCLFCQNYDTSQGRGQKVSPAQLAEIMLALKNRGCANINLVSPTHYTAQILEAADIAAGQGLDLPLVWNTGGYESPRALKLLDGVVDIYMPDMKFWDEAVARELTGVADYPRVNRQAVAEMYAQVGPLKTEGGLAVRGLLVRHLVLPGGLAGSEQILHWLARECPGAGVNVMGQYYPCYQAHRHPQLSRRVSPAEVAQAVKAALRLGLKLV